MGERIREMDKTETYIKMCEKATEIQDNWKPPNGAQFPDVAFTRSAVVYKRKIKGEETSHFVKYDYFKENLHWLEAMDGHLGIVKARHWSSKPIPHYGGFIKVDETYPGGDKGVVEIHGGHRIDEEEWLPQSELIWLPRQDQLQEMLSFPVGTFNDNFWSALGDLYEYAFTPNIFNEFIPLTMEQLCLAFVMKEKYNKVWNNIKWVKYLPSLSKGTRRKK